MQVCPTVTPYARFSANKDSEKLHIALNGWNVDMSDIVDILCTRSSEQRQQIARSYKQAYGHDLVEDLNGGLSGNFNGLIGALTRNPIEYLCMQLHKALIATTGANAVILVEILCTKNNDEIKEIIRTFKQSKFISSCHMRLPSHTN